MNLNPSVTRVDTKDRRVFMKDECFRLARVQLRDLLHCMKLLP